MAVSGSHAFPPHHASRILVSAESLQKSTTKKDSSENKTERITFGEHGNHSYGNHSRTVATASKMNKIFGGLIQAIKGYNPFYTSITDKSGSKLEVNINSLSKRLNIPKKEVVKAIKEKRLQNFLNQILGMRAHLMSVLNENARQNINAKEIPVGQALFCKSGNQDFEYSMLFKTQSDPSEYETIDFKVDDSGLIKTRDGSQFKHLQAMEAYTKAMHEIIANETPVGAVRYCESSHQDFLHRMLLKTQSKPPIFLAVDFQIDDTGLIKTIDGKQFESQEAMVEFLKISAIPSSPDAARALRINAATLQRIVEAAVSQMLSSKKEVSGQVTVENHRYMYAKDMSNRLVILKTSSIAEQNLLGSGASGAVYEVLTSLGPGFVYKMAITHEAKASVIHEYRLLKETINPSDEEIEGLMRTPRVIYQINGSGKTNFGYLTERFTCDALDLSQHYSSQLDPEEIFEGFRQLSTGLEHLHQDTIAVIHGDIKLENISYNDKKWRLIDFGGATCLKELTKEKLKELHRNNKHITVPYTKEYLPPKLIKAIGKAAKDGNVEDYLRLQKFRDQFALGLSFFYMFGAHYNLDWDWSHQELKRHFIENGYSKKLAEAIAKLIIAGQNGTAIDFNLKAIFEGEAEDQKVKMRNARLNYIHRKLTTDDHAMHKIADTYVSTGAVFYCKSGQQDFEYKMLIKTAYHPANYATIDFTIQNDGTVKTSDGRQFKNISAMINFLTIANFQMDQDLSGEERKKVLKNLENKVNREMKGKAL